MAQIRWTAMSTYGYTPSCVLLPSCSQAAACQSRQTGSAPDEQSEAWKRAGSPGDKSEAAPEQKPELWNQAAWV